MELRRLYCKALVFASGGSRLARDWVAGCAAMTSDDPLLIFIALQHSATEADVWALRSHLLTLALAPEAAATAGDAEDGGAAARGSRHEGDPALHPAPAAPRDGGAAEIAEAEQYLLQRSPEARCFVYDAMAASSFHGSGDLQSLEAARRHTSLVGGTCFGLPEDVLTAMWRLVEAELLLKKEKGKILGQSWGE